MRHRPPELSLIAFAFMPFLDIVFAVIGILMVVFALRDSQLHAIGRPLAIDHLIVCEQDAHLKLHLDPRRAPESYRPNQISAIFDRLASESTGVRSLVFAHTGQCFATRHRFEQAFTRHNSLLREDRSTTPVSFRLTFHPLSDDPASVDDLLEHWRGATLAAGQDAQPGAEQAFGHGSD